jgi:hypothetical protein
MHWFHAFILCATVVGSAHGRRLSWHKQFPNLEPIRPDDFALQRIFDFFGASLSLDGE